MIYAKKNLKNMKHVQNSNTVVKVLMKRLLEING